MSRYGPNALTHICYFRTLATRGLRFILRQFQLRRGFSNTMALSIPNNIFSLLCNLLYFGCGDCQLFILEIEPS